MRGSSEALNVTCHALGGLPKWTKRIRLGTRMFDYIVLETKQEELFCYLVEAFRSLAREARREFYLIKTMGGTSLMHPGFEGGTLNVYEGDIDALHEAGLLRVAYGSRGTARYDVPPTGFKYYEYLKSEAGAPVEAVEESVRLFMDAGQFRTAFPEAHDAWSRAAEKLWASDSSKSMTEIGHLCRESMQHFAARLLELAKVTDADPDPAHTVARVRAVLNAKAASKGEAEEAFLQALLPYWGTVSDLVQRQEHGALKEGEELQWEDGRRVVFQTLVVMHEVMKALL